MASAQRLAAEGGTPESRSKAAAAKTEREGRNPQKNYDLRCSNICLMYVFIYECIYVCMYQFQKISKLPSISNQYMRHLNFHFFFFPFGGSQSQID